MFLFWRWIKIYDTQYVHCYVFFHIENVMSSNMENTEETPKDTDDDTVKDENYVP